MTLQREPSPARPLPREPLTDQQPIADDDGALAAAVAAAARSVVGVEGLHTGRFGEVATYLPGRRIDGVQVRADRCAVHLVLAWGAPVLSTADRVRSIVEELVARPVDITIEDVIDPSVPAPASGG